MFECILDHLACYIYALPFRQCGCVRGCRAWAVLCMRYIFQTDKGYPKDAESRNQYLADIATIDKLFEKRAKQRTQKTRKSKGKLDFVCLRALQGLDFALSAGTRIYYYLLHSNHCFYCPLMQIV